LDLRILDLDGSVRRQSALLSQGQAAVHDLGKWGPLLRMACGFRRFKQFASALNGELGRSVGDEPILSFLGSGDFHHITLALLRRIEQPFNLLVLDNHPDWVRGVPILHCGTWLHHASLLPNVRTIFHVGGDVDFDNGYRWLAPWPALRSGKMHVISAVRPLQIGAWANLGFPCLRVRPNRQASAERIGVLVDPLRDELARWPLYVSLDKDVLTLTDAIVNWDSGHLAFAELSTLLRTFIRAAQRGVVGMDVLGDWSPVRLRGLGRRLLHWTEHPRLQVSRTHALQCNERINIALLHLVNSLVTGAADKLALAEAA
jgi:hypothetical protein